jgi:predicted DNA-binding WGR domain protein
VIITHRDGYFLIISQNFTRENFIANANVKTGTYAYELTDRIYRALFSEVVDVKAEYDKYYPDEFENMFEYLQRKYNLKADVIDAIKKHYSKNMILYYGKVHTTGDYNLEQFIYSDQMMKSLDNLLKDKKDEN